MIDRQYPKEQSVNNKKAENLLSYESYKEQNELVKLKKFKKNEQNNLSELQKKNS